jgi:hypothetical protein
MKRSSKRPLSSGWLVAIAMAIFPSNLQAQVKPGVDASEVVATALLQDPQAYKLVYVELAKRALEAHIKNDSQLKSNRAAADIFLKEHMQSAEAYVNGESFRHGWTEAFLKDAVTGANTYALMLTKGRAGVPVNTLNFGIEKFLDQQGSKGTTPELSPELAKRTLMNLLQTAKRSGDPDHQRAQASLQRYLNIDTSVPYDFLPIAKLQTDRELLKSTLTAIQEESKKGSQDREKLVRLISESNELMATIKEAVSDSKTILKEEDPSIREARAEYWKAQLGEVSKGFSNLSALAILAKDEKLAIFCQKSAALAQGIGDVVATSISKAANSPLTYVNVWVGAGILAANLIQNDQSQDATAAMMEMLKEISLQIENLRQEMLARFDWLDFRAKQYFETTFFELQNVAQSVIRLENLGADILKELGAMRLETQAGLGELWLDAMVDWQSRCLPRIDHARSRELLLRCRNQFAQFAMSAWQRPLPNGLTGEGSISKWAQLSNRQYAALKDILKSQPSNPVWLTDDVHPANWLQGSRNFVKLFQNNRNAAGLALSSGLEDRDDLQLARIISAGEKLQQNLNEVALTNEAGKYHLRMNLFDKLLEQYREESNFAITLAETTIKQFSEKGPNPEIGLGQAIIVDADYNFLKKKIAFCDPKAQIEVGYYEHAQYPTTFRPTKPPPPPQASPGEKQEYEEQVQAELSAFRESEQSNKDTNNNIIKEHLKAYSPHWFDWDQRGLFIMPPALVWADRMHFEKIDITPCWRAIRIPQFINNEDGLRIGFHFELEFTVSVGEGDEARKPFTAGTKAILDDEIFVKKYWLTWVPNKDRVPLVWNYWVGQKCPPERSPCTFSWPAARDHMHEKFKVVEIDKPDQRWLEFNRRLQEFYRLAASNVEASTQTRVQQKYSFPLRIC